MGGQHKEDEVSSMENARAKDQTVAILPPLDLTALGRVSIPLSSAERAVYGVGVGASERPARVSVCGWGRVGKRERCGCDVLTTRYAARVACTGSRVCAQGVGLDSRSD
jgi:hypothetical protein